VERSILAQLGLCHECGVVPPPGANYCVGCGAKLRGAPAYAALQGEVLRLRQEIDNLKLAMRGEERLKNLAAEVDSKLQALEGERRQFVEVLKRFEEERGRAWQGIIRLLESPLLPARESIPSESRAIPMLAYPEPSPQAVQMRYETWAPSPRATFSELVLRRLRLPSAIELRLTVAGGLAATTVMTLFLAAFIGTGLLGVRLFDALGAPFAPPDLAPAIGIAVHYGVGILWALIFLIVLREPTVLRGILFSVLQSIVAIPTLLSLILPAAKMPIPVAPEKLAATILMLWLTHVIYAVALVSSIRIMRS